MQGRARTEQENCWRGLQNGLFDLYSSDHCPFRYAGDTGKRSPAGLRSFRHIPNGIPGVETHLPILFSEGVMKGRIDLPRFVALTATNHARTYGLYPRRFSERRLEKRAKENAGRLALIRNPVHGFVPEGGSSISDDCFIQTHQAPQTSPQT
ncbi:hypothetical protein [Maritimibacter sp. HL-12]|uniref:hypothetical protein n=1 Tax=Maritimibacter sp. HL-12 TaxID=1162418 RepID=UPI001C38945E